MQYAYLSTVYMVTPSLPVNDILACMIVCAEESVVCYNAIPACEHNIFIVWPFMGLLG